MGDYQRLQTEAEGEIHLNPVNHSRHNVYYVKHMYFWHKVAFASSVLICVFFIVALLLAPCDRLPCVKEEPQPSTWDKTLNGLELKGRMHLVGGNLIAILRGAKWGKFHVSQFPPKGGGVIALLGRTGKELYWLSLKTLPRYIDCSMLDLITNGVKACLIVGEGGYLAALNPITGLVVWKMVAHRKDSFAQTQPSDIDVPIQIPDLDNDGLRDLVTLSRYTNVDFESISPKLIFISAKNGGIINEADVNPECHQVTNLKYDYMTATLLYTCSNGISSKTETYKVTDVNSRPPKNMDRIMIPEDERIRFEGNISAGEHKVIVSNSGTCPNDCFVSVNVTNSHNKTIWYYHSDRAYIMYPVSLHFKHSITGFLLKLWQWHTPKRTKSVDGITVELIKERIVLITFNKSESMHVVNASQTDIIQLCLENECQPHLSFQTQSAMIADLNNDGTQDLISYFVTYKAPTDDPLKVDSEESIKDWILESRVKVVRLEAELPKLYEAVAKH